MCILIYHKAGKLLTKDQMNEYAGRNPDGFGLMYTNNEGKLEIDKMMNKDEMIDTYLKVVKENPNSPFVVHFRMGTGGTKTIENCHPFRMSDTCGFAHNGVIYKSKKSDAFSDTHAFNEFIMSKVKDSALTNNSVKKLITEYIGSTNKIVVMDNKNQYFIYNEHLGEWEDGIWRSFKTYKEHQHSRNYDNMYQHKICCVCKKSFYYTAPYSISNAIGYTKFICNQCASEFDKYFKHNNSVVHMGG